MLSRTRITARRFSTLPRSSSPHSTAPPLPPISPVQKKRWLSYSTLFASGLLLGGTLVAVLPRNKVLRLLLPDHTPHPPPADSPAGLKHTEEIESLLQSLPIVQQLRASPPGTYKESRPYSTALPGAHSLSAYTLRGPGKFAVPPLVFVDSSKKGGEATFVLHLGGALCGHEGVIHGGLLATILDESLGMTSFFSLPGGIGVTAWLKVQYRKPTFAEQFVVIKTKTERVEGRKAWVKGRLEDLDGNLLAEAEGLFVEPKMAKFLKNSTAKEMMQHMK